MSTGKADTATDCATARPTTIIKTRWGQVTLTLTEAAPVEAQYLTPEEVSQLTPVSTVHIQSRYAHGADTPAEAWDSDMILQLRAVPRPYRWQAVLAGSATAWTHRKPYFQLRGSIIFSGQRGQPSQYQTGAQRLSELCAGIEQCFGAFLLSRNTGEGGHTGCAIRWACERATESGDAVKGAYALATAAAKLLDDAGVLTSRQFIEAQELATRKAADKAKMAEQAHESDKPYSEAETQTARIKIKSEGACREESVLVGDCSGVTGGENH